MPRIDKLKRYPDVVAWRKKNPEHNRTLNRESGANYRGEPGSRKRRLYNQAQRERAIRRQARAVAKKAVEKATAAAKATIAQNASIGYSGKLLVHRG